MTTALTTSSSSRRDNLSDVKLRESVAGVVRRLVPADEVDDVVQAAFTEALVAAGTPEGPEDLRRWVIGIARHKAADLHRRRRREQVGDTPDVEAPSGPQSASDLLRWAEKELPEGEGAHETLTWMLREGAGEKLESIAESEHIPAPRIRQRVARMRKHFRERWAEQTAIGVSAIVAIVVGLWAWRRFNPPDRIVRDVPSAWPAPTNGDPIQRGQEMRRFALEQCRDEKWKACLDGLDEAAKLDPEGDVIEDVQKARQAARDHLAVPPINSNTPTTPAPSSSGGPSLPPSERGKDSMDRIGDIQAPAPTTKRFGSDAPPSDSSSTTSMLESGVAPVAPPPTSGSSDSMSFGPKDAVKPSMGKPPGGKGKKPSSDSKAPPPLSLDRNDSK